MSTSLFKRSGSFATVPFFMATLLLSGCGGDGAPAPSANPPPQAGDPGTGRKLISSLKFEDPVLTECVKNSASLENALYADQLTALNCAFSGVLDAGDPARVQSVSGLEQLVALEDINFVANHFKEIDLRPFKKLRTFRAGLSLLEKLDASQLPELETLEVENVKPLQLDLSGSPKLIFLRANQVSELNLPQEAPITNLLVGFLPLPHELFRLTQQGNSAIYKDGRYEIDLTPYPNIESVWLSGSIEEVKLPMAPRLKSLYIISGALEGLDVSHASNLTSLGVGFSDSLKTLDLQPLTKLQTLSIDANGISTLDLSKMTDLTTLRVVGHELTSLDLGNPIRLNQLTVEANKLPSLAIDKFSNLETLSVEGDNLNNIDLPVSENLRLLNLKAGKVTTIDLKTNPISNLTIGDGALNNIDGINDHMRVLEIGNNKLASLDLINAISLEQLYVGNNRLNTLDLSRFPRLSFVTIGRNNISTLDLSQSTGLHYLDLSRNPIRPDLLKITSGSLQRLSNPPVGQPTGKFISEVQIPDQALRDCIAATALEQGITYVDEMKRLDCHGLDDKTFWSDFSHFSEVITHIFSTDGLEAFTELTYLDLSINYLTSFDVTKFQKLATLNLSQNFLRSLNLESAIQLETLAVNSNPLKQTKLPKYYSKLKSLEVRGGPETLYISYIIDLTAMLNAPANVPFTYQDYFQGLGGLDLSGQTGLIYLDTTRNGRP